MTLLDIKISSTVLVAIIGAAVGIGGSVLTYFFTRKKEIAGTMKLTNEAGDILVTGEFKLSEFYKKQLEDLIKKYNNMEKKYDKLIQENEAIKKQHDKCTEDYNALRIEITKLTALYKK